MVQRLVVQEQIYVNFLPQITAPVRAHVREHFFRHSHNAVGLLFQAEMLHLFARSLLLDQSVWGKRIAGFLSQCPPSHPQLPRELLHHLLHPLFLELMMMASRLPQWWRALTLF